MANRRMFSKTITSSSRFLMMPQSSQNLYFHIGMNADDDGFCEHFTIMRMTDSKPDDLKVLQAKGFIKVFDDKVLIVVDWKENNYLRSDRYTPSKYLNVYKEEIVRLCSGIPEVDKWLPQVRLGKVRKEEITDKQVVGVDILIDYLHKLKGGRRNRYLKVAKDIFEFCDNDAKKSMNAVLTIKNHFENEGLEWSPELVIKRIDIWQK